MAATTLLEMRAGQIVLLAGNDQIFVDIVGIDSYKIWDKRPTGQGREGTSAVALPALYDYDVARTTFNTAMVDLS